MRLVDLLVKIANGEEVPKKIRFQDRAFIFDKEVNDYKNEIGLYFFESFTGLTKFLNDKIEIIEEDTSKKIKKIEYVKYTDEYVERSAKDPLHRIEIKKHYEVRDIVDKINEVIDVLNSLERKD